MLKQRVITAIVLLLAFLSAIFLLPPVGWVAVATLVAALAAWEWGGLMQWGKAGRVVLGLATAASAFCREFSHRERADVDFQSENVPRDLPADSSPLPLPHPARSLAECGEA